MAKRIHPKILLVEGNEDRRVIPELIEANGVPWGETADEAVVFIKEFEGVSNLLKPGVIEAELKASGVRVVGIMIDADNNGRGRFNRILERCKSVFPEMPDNLPEDGLIHSNDDGLRVGVWLMPDNKSHGMLESFLLFLAPTENDLVKYAKKASKVAQRMGAPYKAVHSEKAYIYTWLAWQNEPGAQLHQAVKEHILDPASPHAASFVNWFRGLFEV